jgi:hypothetical protein
MKASATSRRFDWQSNSNHPAASIANQSYSRRALLSRASTGFGMAALAGLMQEESQAALVHRAKRFAPKARSVIFCYMSGGVSHIDSFDPKPLLEKYAGKPMPGAGEEDAVQQQRHGAALALGLLNNMGRVRHAR